MHQSKAIISFGLNSTQLNSTQLGFVLIFLFLASNLTTDLTDLVSFPSSAQ
jgi:hypothetical protein